MRKGEEPGQNAQGCLCLSMCRNLVAFLGVDMLGLKLQMHSSQRWPAEGS